MKVIICGKGGSGKSTITALLARHYSENGHKVLVIDTDESNASLNRILGMESPKDLMEYFGGKRGMMEKFRKSGEEDAKPSELNWTFDDIPDGFISRKGEIGLVAIGKIHEAGEGCACPMGILSRRFISELKLSDKDVVIVDTEAGIEHFGRGIDQICDVILMIIDPSYESLHLSKEVSKMAEKIEVPVYYILNKIDTKTSSYLRNGVDNKEAIIAEFTNDPELLVSGLEGKELPGDYPGIFEITEKIGVK
ncbi:Cobyrinic acid ac-diamide synthase [Methanolacinia petrolearia DSM 11571]|uniref:Cobyrinic acid ac-diamide synthase n=1 Tax=Methanolacinia petrolearia (strain DSM 11571 / OCM 486 / SEBR 4847) TaxID=679926 RepID=E1RI17_METP4|nr:P-loop NTPase [Methanolacinia petrolearia]ADN35402.1 Cobyrinic acid ac-diamide synthase [Methanolacinia petrolearia DSM 11571]